MPPSSCVQYEIRFHRDITIVFKWVKLRVSFTLYFNIIAFCAVSVLSFIFVRVPLALACSPYC
jgi:hypothetical protein